MMCCVVTCGLKLFLQLFNAILFVAFIGVAVFGILLKCSKTVVRGFMVKVFEKYDIGEKQMRELVNFFVDNADGIATILIVVGFALAALCLIGFIASCCGCSILLMIYAAVLILLLIAEIVIVAIMFSDKTRLSSLVLKAMEDGLKDYNKTTSLGSASTAAWNLVMTVGNFCCGLDNYTDFGLMDQYPAPCCLKNITDNMTTVAPTVFGFVKDQVPPTPLTCPASEAKSLNVDGCRAKIVDFVNKNSKIMLYISIVAIVLQAILILIVMLTICL